MWHLANYVIQCVFPYAYGKNIGKLALHICT